VAVIVVAVVGSKLSVSAPNNPNTGDKS
jgi:hypothetical protein